MEIVITAIHCDVSEAVRDYAREKIARLDKFFDKTRKTAVTIHAEPGNNEVELICHATGGHVFTVHVVAEESVREGIDLAIDKMGKQLKRYKDRLRGHKGKDKRKKLVRDLRRITQRLSKLEEQGVKLESGADFESDEDTDDED